MPPAVGFQRRELVVEDLLGLVEQPPDQGRLAVVDTAARDEPQQLLLLLRGEPFANVGGPVQKYPSCFFFSIDALPASRSIARPWRSLVADASISAMMSSTLAASLSTAPDSG